MTNQIDPFDIRNYKSFSQFKKTFLTKLPKNYNDENMYDLCWNWKDSTNNKYCKIRYGSENYYVHRMSYMIFKGPISYGLLVRHTCDNPGCVNPNHLILGSHSDNINDMCQRGRHVGNKKLTIKEVIEIKIALKSSYHGLVKELAVKYDVVPMAISLIKANKRWSWVTI